MAGSGCNAYQIRKIYAIGGALGMVKRNEEDDLLHELVEGMTGKKSIKALTYGEACKVIGELEGRQGTPPPRKSGKPLRKTAPILRTKKQSLATAAFCTQYYPIQALFEGRARTICP